MGKMISFFRAAALRESPAIGPRRGGRPFVPPARGAIINGGNDMTYEIIGEPTPVVICELNSGEQMITERGSMAWMS